LHEIKPDSTMPEYDSPCWTEEVSPERRAVPRYSCRQSLRVRLPSLWICWRWRATVWNLSTRGIGLQLGKRVPLGTVFEVPLKTEHAGLAEILSVRVVHATRQPEGLWLIGCTLTTELTEQQLVALL
jgi:hypothetical protein